MIKNVVSIQLPVAEQAVLRKNRVLPPGITEKQALERKLPRICIVTGTHGDELEGQYVCFRLNRILAERSRFVTGIVDIYPAINPLGIDSITRAIPRFDLDMNRIFPGNPEGTTEEAIAAGIIEDMKSADCAVDIHASNIFLREIPQVRINVNTAERLLPLARELNCDFIWVHAAATVLESTLAWSLNSIGVPCLVIEAGVGMRITQEYGEKITAGLLRLMKRLGVWSGPVQNVTDPIVSTDGRVGFVNANYPGIFIPKVRHWMNIHRDETLGIITDPTDGRILEEVKSPCNGLVFTLREYPVVNPGSLVARVLDVETPATEEGRH